MTSKPIPSAEIAATIGSLYEMGVEHVGYYPDMLFENHPDWSVIRKALSSEGRCAADPVTQCPDERHLPRRMAARVVVRLLLSAVHVVSVDDRRGAVLLARRTR